MKELYFSHGMTIVKGPGDAVYVNAGEVMAFEDGLADRLAVRPGIKYAAPGTDARRVTHKERATPGKDLFLVAPPLHQRPPSRDDQMMELMAQNQRLMSEMLDLKKREK
jgi:hypothetical protein